MLLNREDPDTGRDGAALVHDRQAPGAFRRPCYLGASSEPARCSGLQQLSELREGHVIWDETLASTGQPFLRRVANDVSLVGDGLDEAPTATLLARQLDGDR